MKEASSKSPLDGQRFIESISSWLVFAYLNLRYLAARRGIGRAVPWDGYADHVIRVAYQMFHYRKRLRTVNEVLCPDKAPAVFICNHYKLDDPIFLWPAIFQGSSHNIMVKFMMRDDFFQRFPFKWWLLDLNEVAELCNAMLISRDQLSISQLRPFLDLLEEPGAFLMFPGRSRSRSGLCLEYRDDVGDPASVAFFVSQAQRRKPGASVPAVPMGRTYHGARKMSSVIFGEPLYLPSNAARAEQRVFDRELILRMSDLIEVNALHFVAAVAWLRCLHGRLDPVPLARLELVVVAAVRALSTRYFHPELTECLGDAIRLAIAHFSQTGLMRIDGDALVLDRARILHTPALTTHYNQENAVKYHVNQVFHLSDVTAVLEAAALLDPELVKTAGARSSAENRRGNRGTPTRTVRVAEG